MRKNNTRKIRLFVDFDGTVTNKDVGNSIIDKFLPPDLIKQGWHEKILEEWKTGKISSEECLTLEFKNCIVTEEEFNTELDTFTLTPGFIETVQYCRNHDIPIMILSDGLDYYIEYILAKYDISAVDYRSNHMYFYNGCLEIEFPYIDKGCGRCGNCKRWHIEKLRRDGDLVIYAGDGYSDRFAIRSADVVFARRDLADFCEKEDLKYIHYNNFNDLLDYFEETNGTI